MKNDIKKRKENNKLQDFSNIKCSWNTFCKNNFLKKNIEKIVLNINKISFLSYRREIIFSPLLK